MPSGQKFTVAFHVPGTLTADLAIKFTAPANCQLIHASAVGSNTYKAGLSLGTSTGATDYMAKKSIGSSGTPQEFARADFVGAQFPRITDGVIVAAALDYDYNNGGAANASADVTLVLTFLEG